MRTVIAVAVFATIFGGMWLTFDLLARAAAEHPVEPWTV
jgi:hypothetical protein